MSDLTKEQEHRIAEGEYFSSGKVYEDRRSPYPSENGFHSGWQACSTYKNKHIVELEAENSRLGIEWDNSLREIADYKERIEELEAEIKKYKNTCHTCGSRDKDINGIGWVNSGRDEDCPDKWHDKSEGGGDE